MGKKHKMRLKAAFGVTEEGIIDVPKKISNVQIARIEHGEDQGCPFCFPHGMETSNSTFKKNRRSWKNNRKNQYRIKLKHAMFRNMG